MVGGVSPDTTSSSQVMLFPKCLLAPDRDQEERIENFQLSICNWKFDRRSVDAFTQ